jgi:anti-sigma factor RsiW
MSAASERMLKLMAYADGELEGDERLEVEELLATDSDAASIVAQMGSLGEFVRLGHEDAVAPRIAKIDLTDAIMAAVANEKTEQAGAKPGASNVASFDAARARRRKIGTVTVAALALAASLFFVIRQNQQAEAPIAHVPAKPAKVEAVTPAATEAPPAGALASTGPGVEVDAVESPGHSVSVFYLPSESELSTSVLVWVDETGEK